MADKAKPNLEESRYAPLHLTDRPVELRFGFETQKSGVGVGASVAAHLAAVVVMFLVMRLAPQALPPQVVDDPSVIPLVYLPIPGPGGGGGGGNDPKPEPPRKAQIEQKKDPVSVPTTETPKPTPKPPEPLPELPINVPFKEMSAAEMTLPGVVSQNAPAVGSAGSGPGTGAGTGQGSGIGPGYGGGFGGGAFRPGAGITLPTVVREVKPAYTADAMRAKVQGSVWLECIVMPDGTVGDVKVTRSLDPIFGLDQEAIKAAKQWRFRPGMRQGQPVPVIITIELTFTLR
ncbi:MAG TPA: energy transducer TonB [Vicinamibacterales bacterium]|jgi:protein TonB